MEEQQRPKEQANDSGYQFELSERGEKLTIKAKKTVSAQKAEQAYFSILEALFHIGPLELEILKEANVGERVGRYIDINLTAVRDKLKMKSMTKIYEALDALHEKGILLKTKYNDLYDLIYPIAEYKDGKSIQIEVQINVAEQ
jgi:hypothetical protein